jgi:hypothetical protein
MKKKKVTIPLNDKDVLFCDYCKAEIRFPAMAYGTLVKVGKDDEVVEIKCYGCENAKQGG